MFAFLLDRRSLVHHGELQQKPFEFGVFMDPNGSQSDAVVSICFEYILALFSLGLFLRQSSERQGCFTSSLRCLRAGLRTRACVAVRPIKHVTKLGLVSRYFSLKRGKLLP